MAIFRSVFFYSPLLHRPLQHLPLSKSTFCFPNYSCKFSKSTKLPLLHQNPRPCCTSSMESPPEGYRKNVGICLINPSKKIFAASRLDIPDAWQMPQGGIDEIEDPKAAAIRELKEETGVSSAEVLAEKSGKNLNISGDLTGKVKHRSGFSLNSQGMTKRSIYWVMAQKNLSLASGHGCHQKKSLTGRWISRNLYTRKFWQFLLPISNKFMFNINFCLSYTWCTT